jgi:hypothetical protein
MKQHALQLTYTVDLEKEVPLGVMYLFGISPEAIQAEIDRHIIDHMLKSAKADDNEGVV